METSVGLREEAVRGSQVVMVVSASLSPASNGGVWQNPMGGHEVGIIFSQAASCFWPPHSTAHSTSPGGSGRCVSGYSYYNSWWNHDQIET